MLIKSSRPKAVRSSHPAQDSPSKTETYLHNLLSDVAGKELHRAGLNVKVHCRPGERPYRIENGDIVVDPSLLSTLSGKEELAFVLAQQAALLITGSDPSGLQVGADLMAFDMMSEAGLNPSGGYQALEKLYSRYPTEPVGEGLLKAVKVAASGAEHEGIRLAAAQLQLEKMRRAGEPATRKDLTEAPEILAESELGASPELRPSSSLDHTLERAFARLEGKPHEARVEGVLESLMLATKSGRVGPLSDDNKLRMSGLLSDMPESETVDRSVHARFLQTLLGSDSLRETLHPLGKPWQEFVTGLIRKRGRFGLPESLSVLNHLYRSGQKVEVPEEAVKARDQAVSKALVRPYQRSEDLSRFLSELYRSREWAPFTEELEEKLPLVLLDIARTVAVEPSFQHTLGEPAPLHPDMERAYLTMLKKPIGEEDRKAVTGMLTLHQEVDQAWPEDELSKRKLEALLPSARQALATGFSAKTFPEIMNSLATIYSLDPAQLGGSKLSTLLERVRSGEFEPKAESFADKRDYRRALKEQRRVRAEEGLKLRLAAARQSQSVLVPLTAVAADPSSLKDFLATMDVPRFARLLEGAEEALEQSRILKGLAGSDAPREHVNFQAGQAMMKSWLAVQDRVRDAEEWYDLTRRTIDFCSPVLEMDGCREELGAALAERLDGLQSAQQSRWLRKPYVSHLLPSQSLEELLCGELDAKRVDRVELSKRVSKLESEFQLSTKRPMLYSGLRNRVVQEAQLQPQDVDSVFPPDPRNSVELAESLSVPLAGLSGILTLTREEPAEVQLKTIEYLMGQSKEYPAFLEQLDEHQGFLPMHALLRQVREELKNADQGMRIMVANAFLAGPSGLLRQEGGRETLLAHFTEGMREEERHLVTRLTSSVLQVQGEADSLAVAALLAQKSRDGKAVTEAEMISSFFDAYGVPGIKMKQYFAFTTDNKAHREAFAAAQDNAQPVSHYQALKLLQDRFGGKWPEHLKVRGLLGNGSVNVAVKLFNEETGQIEIASVNRRDIQKATEYDFRRFKALFETLTQNPEDEEEFGFVLGLMKIVKDSVDLEFDRDAAMTIQKTAFDTYDHNYDGWHVRSIDAYRASNQSLFMEEAKGTTARKLKASNPELYKQAMTAMHKAEMSVLRGQPEQGDVLPRALFANPDFHDGQVLVDTDTREVTILDFGQAVPISVEERKAALDLLTVFGKGDGPKTAAKRLNKRFFGKEKVLTKEQLEPILSRKDMMGRFIHLLSLVAREGGEVPLASVNWILGLNRQISLGKSLGLPVEREVKTMVASHKLGLGLGTANTLNAMGRTLTRVGSALTGWCCAGAVPALY